MRHFTAILLAVFFVVFAVAIIAKSEQAPDNKTDGAKAAKEEEKVKMTVSYAPQNCDAAHPLQITVLNGSPLIVIKTDWIYEVYRIGFSTQLAEGDRFEADSMIRPGEEHTFCTELPEFTQRVAVPASELEYRIADRNVAFREPKEKQGRRLTNKSDLYK